MARAPVLESSLHELVTTEIVKLFQSKKDNAARLIFTGCSPMMLDMDFGKGQIYFMNLKDDRSVELYSLIRLRGVRTQTGFGTHYLSGIYGAVPEIENKFEFDSLVYDLSDEDEDDNYA